MLHAILGVILFAMSAVVYSSPYNATLVGYRVKNIILPNIIVFLLLIGRGLATLFNFEPPYFAMFIALMLLLIAMNLNLLRFLKNDGSIKLGKECFEAVIYVAVIHLFLVHI